MDYIYYTVWYGWIIHVLCGIILAQSNFLSLVYNKVPVSSGQCMFDNKFFFLLDLAGVKINGMENMLICLILSFICLIAGVTTIWYQTDCDGCTALPCDGLFLQNRLQVDDLGTRVGEFLGLHTMCKSIAPGEIKTLEDLKETTNSLLLLVRRPSRRLLKLLNAPQKKLLSGFLDPSPWESSKWAMHTDGWNHWSSNLGYQRLFANPKRYRIQLRC